MQFFGFKFNDTPTQRVITMEVGTGKLICLDHLFQEESFAQVTYQGCEVLAVEVLVEWEAIKLVVVRLLSSLSNTMSTLLLHKHTEISLW